MHSGDKVLSERGIPTRGSLISRLRHWDDHESWRAFFETYWRLIYSFAIKRGCTDAEAEEVVQETIICISKKMPEFKYDPVVCSFKGWLMHVADCRVIDQLRKRNHRLVRKNDGSSCGLKDGGLNNVPDPLGPELESIWKEEWEKNLIGAAMERVKRQANPQHFQIFHLHAVKGYSTEKIAEVLSVNRGQVYLAKHRVGAMVKKEIQRLEKTMI
jgi:RNA polymerase sigma-70 factor (ECF subfamily)